LLEHGAGTDRCNSHHQSPLDVAANDDIRRLLSNSQHRTMTQCVAPEDRVIARFSPIQSFWPKTEKACCILANTVEVKQKDPSEERVSHSEKDSGKNVEQKQC
jgi:hypothetical protein